MSKAFILHIMVQAIKFKNEFTDNHTNALIYACSHYDKEAIWIKQNFSNILLLEDCKFNYGVMQKCFRQ